MFCQNKTSLNPITDFSYQTINLLYLKWKGKPSLFFFFSGDTNMIHSPFNLFWYRDWEKSIPDNEHWVWISQIYFQWITAILNRKYGMLLQKSHSRVLQCPISKSSICTCSIFVSQDMTGNISICRTTVLHQS